MDTMINTADVDILPALSLKAEKDSSPSTKNADVDKDSKDGFKKEEEAQSVVVDSEQGDFPWRWKLTALALGIFLSGKLTSSITKIVKQSRAEKLRLIIRHVHFFITVGSSFSESTLGPLKSTLIRELKIDNAQVSASGLSNIVFVGDHS